MARKSLEKILIIQTAFLGDVILATGLVEKVYEHFPEARIDFLIRSGYETLFENHPKIGKVIQFNKQRNKLFNMFRIIREIRSRKYDLVINVQRYFSSGVFTVFSGGGITTGFDKNPLSFLFSRKIKHAFNGLHEFERNHRLIESFTDNRPARPALYPQQKNYEKTKDYRKRKYICIAPASLWFTKQFPVDKWLEVIGSIPSEITIYLLGSSADRLMAEMIREKAKHEKMANLCGRMSLLDTCALVEGALLNFVNDSAPMHLASAMNAPVCAVYCSTVPSFGYGPLSDRSFIMEIKGDLYCRPCGIHGRRVCPEGHFKCAYNIGKDQVRKILSEVM